MEKRIDENFQAAASLVIDQVEKIEPADLSRLFNLYLPFLGPKGVALYQFLVAEKAAASEQKTTFSNHYLLLDTLSMSAPDFVRARRALEGVGLLRHYQSEVDGRQAVRYLIQKPLNAADFFKEDLLSGLLFHYVGEARYQVLAKRFASPALHPLPNERDQSATFLSVFDLPDTTQKPKTAVQSKKPNPLPSGFDQVSFDFEGMVALVHGSTPEKIEKARQLILTEQVLYGLNEAQMATAVTRSINLDDHELNKGTFLAYLAQTWSAKQQKNQLVDQPAEPNSSATTNASGAANAQKTSSQKTGNRALDALYQAANNLSPVDFIGQIKEQNHGYVTNSERRLLKDLLDQRILPVPAINLLTYQVLVNMDQADLKRNLVDAIANSWAKAGVQSAEDAVAAIKAHQQRGQQASSSKSANWQRRSNKQEPALTSNEAASQQSVDSDAVKKTLDLMKNYKTKD
ncbi:DnaD domain protein [Fructobacillus sp. M158]|uniref:DnaD domain protein n=1 Tax=Fructobacillus parabroussonetiae TaxID=2713174 RepID=UPI002009EA3C|nr:DnaD domain protein [Fructobacillus parabroussonetiae]MCK8617858.1 DnaD domain protein [Fructobacillus parabroussonetiae]